MALMAKSGRYRHYACSRRRRLTQVACGGNNVPMQQADNAVLDALEKRLFQPDRLRILIKAMFELSGKAIAKRTRHLASIRAELTANTMVTRNLLALIEMT